MKASGRWSRSSTTGNSRDNSLFVQRLVDVAQQFELEQQRQNEELNLQLSREMQLREQQKKIIELQAIEIETLKIELAKLRDELVNISDTYEGQKSVLTRELIVTRFKLADVRTQFRTKHGCAKNEKGSNNDENADPNGTSDTPPAANLTAAASPSPSPSPAKVSPAPESKQDSMDDPVEKEQFSKECLYSAAENGDLSAIDRILDPQSQDSDEFGKILGVALGKSCISGNTHIVRKLLGLGAKIDSLLPQDQLPLHVAAENGHYDTLKFLLDQQACDVDARDANGCTPLYLACISDQYQCVELLMLAGSDCYAKDNTGKPLAEATSGAEAARALKVLQDVQLSFWNRCTRGNQVYQKGDYQQAFRLFSDALTISDHKDMVVSPKDKSTINYNCARAAMHFGQCLTAIKFCDKAIAIDDSFFKSWKLRGECYLDLFDFSNAINSFTQATKLLPDEKIRQELLAAEKARDANNYEILHVEMTASEKQLKVAYRKACLKWHPDKHNNGEDAQYRANCMFKRITAAYEVIKDPFKRILHDMEIRRKSKPDSGVASKAEPSPSPSPSPTPYKSRPAGSYAARYSPSFEAHMDAHMDGVDDGEFDDSVDDDWMDHVDDQDMVDDELLSGRWNSFHEREETHVPMD